MKIQIRPSGDDRLRKLWNERLKRRGLGAIGAGTLTPNEKKALAARRKRRAQRRRGITTIPNPTPKS